MGIGARFETASSRRIVIITGPRDSGKTRTASTMAGEWRAQGLSVAGIISEAVLSGGTKVRYEFLDLVTGERLVYALRRVPDGVPAYEFLDCGLQFGCAAIRKGMESGAAVLVIDEIGPLEMAGGGLWLPAREAASGFPGRIVLTVRPALVAELLSRLRLAPGDVDVVTAR